MKEEAKRWFDKSMKDLGNAEYNLDGKKYDLTVFLVQQSVEKSLKAMQIENSNTFDKVHDLLVLGKKVNAPEEILNFCKDISPFYTIARYPDVEEEVDGETAKEILKKGKKVNKWVEKTLKH